MKNSFYITLLFCGGMLWAQEDGTVKEKDFISNVFLYDEVENLPIFNKCKPKMSRIEQKTCTSKKIGKIFQRNFNYKLPKKLNLPEGITRVYVLFKINEEGDISDIYVKGSHPALELEVFRVFNLVPKFDRPGFRFGQPVSVIYSIPIAIKVEAERVIEYNQKPTDFRQF